MACATDEGHVNQHKRDKEASAEEEEESLVHLGVTMIELTIFLDSEGRETNMQSV
jgi:hypothetical protein